MQASAPSPPDRLPGRVWRRPVQLICRCKTVLLPPPLSPPRSASLSFSLRPPSAIRRLRRAAASTMSQFPLPRRHDDQSCKCRTPSYPVLRVWSITIRWSRSRSRAPLDPPNACRRAGLPSRPRRSAIDTSLHPTRRHIPREAGALYPVEEASTARRPCRPRAADDEDQVPRRLAHLFPESGHSSGVNGLALVQLNRRRRPMKEIPHQRALATFRRAGSDCATRKPDWPTAQTTCRARLGFQFYLTEI